MKKEREPAPSRSIGPTLCRQDPIRRLRYRAARHIINLLWLAPDIQEALLVAEIANGRDWVTAKELMPIARCASWAEQRRDWARAVSRATGK